MLKKIDHLGIAVNSIEKARDFFENTLGLTCEGVETVESQKVKTAFYSVGETHIELLEATSTESPVAKYLEKNGEGLHHIAFQTDSVEGQLDQAEKCGCSLTIKWRREGMKIAIT